MVDKRYSLKSPFEFLAEMQNEFQGYLLKRKKEELNTSGWLGLMFLSGHTVLMAPLSEVSGIVPVTVFRTIPGVKPWMLGMTSYRGEIIPVTDLSGMLTSQLSVITKDSRIMLVRTQEEYAGFLVNRILGLQRVTKQESPEKVSKGLMGVYKPFVIGAISNEKFELPIISCQAVIKHPKFKDVQLKTFENKYDIKTTRT